MKKQKGITLVALIITIIVMVILAGVAISLVTGEKGVMTQAETANAKMEQTTIEDTIKSSYYYDANNAGKLSFNDTRDAIIENLKDSGYTQVVIKGTKVNSVETFPMTVQTTGKTETYTWVIEQAGGIKEEKDIPQTETNEYYYTENEDGTITIKGPKKVRVLRFTEENEKELEERISSKFGEGIFEEYCNGTIEDELGEEIDDYYEEIIDEITYDTNNEKFWTTVELEESQVGLEDFDEVLNADEIALVDITTPLPTEIDGKEVTAIGKNAFYDITVYSSNFIPNTVKHIGDFAFRRSSFVSQLIIPDSVQTIGEEAFRRMRCFGDVELIMNDAEGNLVSIGSAAFEDSDLMGTLNLRKEVSVSASAFSGTDVIVNYK